MGGKKKERPDPTLPAQTIRRVISPQDSAVLLSMQAHQGKMPASLAELTAWLLSRPRV